MKKIISFIILILCTFGLTSCSKTGNYKFTYLNKDEYKAGSTVIEGASKLRKIHVNWFDGTLTINVHDEDTIIIEETTNSDLDDDHKVHYQFAPNTDGTQFLMVEFSKSGVSDFEDSKKDLVLTVPKYTEYYIGIISYSASVNVNLDSYENTIDKLSINNTLGPVYANVYNVGTVQIAGYNKDSGSSNDKVFSLKARGYIATLGMNSTYAKIILEANQVYGMDNFGSVHNETRFEVNKADKIKLSNVDGITYIKANEFKSMDLSFREKDVYIYTKETSFTLNITIESSAPKNTIVTPNITGFNAVKISDSTYKVDSGDKKINIVTYAGINIEKIE